MALITRYVKSPGNAVLDEFDDGRSFAYFKGLWFEELVVKIATDSSTSIIASGHPEWSEIEEIGSNSVINLAGRYSMDDTRHFKWRLVLWFEMFWWPQIGTVWQTHLTETRDNQIQILKGAMASWYVPSATAETLAINLVDNLVKPKYTDIVITDVPLNFIRLSTGE